MRVPAVYAGLIFKTMMKSLHLLVILSITSTLHALKIGSKPVKILALSVGVQLVNKFEFKIIYYSNSNFRSL